METRHQSQSNAWAQEGFSIAVIIAALTYKYWGLIDQKLHDPVFNLILALGIVFGGVVFYVFAHYIEKFANQINMRRLGIIPDDKVQGTQLEPFSFDLQGQLKSFYQNKDNRDQTFLGLYRKNKREKGIASIPDIQRSQHTQVLGMTGTGKTSGIFLPLIYQDALKKHPVIILDAKGELSSINQLNALLKSIGRTDDFLLFSLVHKNQSCTYNPLYVGECDPQIVIDAFFSNFKDENSFYRETAKTIFTNAFYVLHSLGKPFTVMDIYTYLTNDTCHNAINDLVEKSDSKGDLYLRLLNTMISCLCQQYKGWQHVITGFNNYLLAHKEIILNDPDSDIVLTDVIRQRKIVYFQLPTNAYPIQAVSIARMVQANLRYISSLIQIGQLPKDILVSVIIDEYASFAEESFIEVLNKARSSGMMVTIAHQSLSDLRAISEAFMKRIDENTLNKIYLKQTDPELCELIAKSMGTFIKEEKTYRMTGGRFGNQIYTGESSNKVVNEFYFPPDRIKNLHKRGQGYFIYRGTNSQQCVNLGYFFDLKEEPYKRKIKLNKREGIGLFEKYYIERQEKPSIQVIPLKINSKESLDD
ncbi:MAG: TraM recognition domain-containing protein [Candidatus Omnitrophica bacterium]|nr:TraM recognition domain-containing protein [Candidatus Omnitrophota bacterium]MDE2214335.1 TraM recognition domain-containing protein [Candidatus Omnitrophota bacterium]MDE2231084.1 TraM recognition domain-containing protein [Candidatus Omnitrophota bacterium]